MESALIGLLGVIVGSVLATAKDWWLHHYKLRVEGRHLSLMIAFALDRYVEKAAEVANDDGDENEDGLTIARTQRPKFDPASIQGDWRSLPVELTNEVFDLQLSAEAADGLIDFAFEYEATPPDFWAGFEARQREYSALGLRAFDLANRLRLHATVHPRAATPWPIGRLKEVQNKFAELKAQREAERAPGDA